MVGGQDGARRVIPAHPPSWSCEAIVERGEWPSLRPIVGVVECPVLRPDGSILDAPGYDPATRLYYDGTETFPPIPASPTRPEVEAAVKTLLELVADFPFAETLAAGGGTPGDGGAAHRAAWLAALLTTLGRHAIDGPTPLFRLDANSSGAGKTKLAQLMAIVATGGRVAANPWPSRAEEQEKLILSLAMAAEPIVLFDNVQSGASLGGAALDAALTATSIKGRVLGQSRMSGDVPWRTILLATGNNLAAAGDGLRRIIPCRLETPEDRPERRTGFRIEGDLLLWARDRRPLLVAAGLTILRGFLEAGSPTPRPALPPMDFVAWCGLIRHAVHWATGIDPASTREAMIEEDRGAIAERGLIAGFAELQRSVAPGGLTAAEALRHLEDHANRDRFVGLRDTIAEWWTSRDTPTPKLLGQRLAAIRGKVIGGDRIVSEDRRGTACWRVERVAKAPGPSAARADTGGRGDG